jgi:hypothetical protein
MVRSLAVVTFIGCIAAAALYVAQRPTIARGDVVGEDLLESNRTKLRGLRCDPEIRIGIDGAKFACRAEFLTGAVERLEFKMDRAGSISQVGSEPEPERRVQKSDPWGD